MLSYSIAFSYLVCISVMVGVSPNAIGCVFGDLTLRILDRIDFGQHYEFQTSDESFIISISYEMLSLR